jgi:hypothetical protein
VHLLRVCLHPNAFSFYFDGTGCSIKKVRLRLLWLIETMVERKNKIVILFFGYIKPASSARLRLHKRVKKRLLS